jgi:drug/metabolite transporter (DMT)-like permease
MQRAVADAEKDNQTAPARPPDSGSRTRAVGLMCVAILLFSMLDTTAKYLITSVALPFPELVWFRFVSQLVLMMLVLGLVSLPRLARPRKPGHQLIRSLLLMGSTLFNFLVLRYLRLDQTVTISFMMPLLVALLGGPLLGEWVGWRRMLAIGVGFAGVLVVVRPGFGDVHPAVALSLLGTVCYALYNLSTRYLAAHDEADVTLFWGLLAAVVVLTPFVALDWTWPPGALAWALLIAMGALGGFGHYLLILAHRQAPASILAPFTYLGLLSVTGTGYLVFGDLPDRWTIAGSAIIIASGLYLLHRERVRRAEARDAKAKVRSGG